MNAKELMGSDVEAWVRLIALERAWNQPRDEILALVLHECRGVHSELNVRLKDWMSHDRNAGLATAERVPGSGSWIIYRKTDA